MDIYFGSSTSLNLDQILNLDHSVSRLSAGYQKNLNQNTDYFSVWKNGCGESRFFADDKYEVLFDGYLYPYTLETDNKWLSTLADRIIKTQKVLHSDESGIFNIAIRIKETGTIYLANDPGGLLPLYYTKDERQFYFFSHLYLTAQALQSQPDYLGILTKLLLGYTLGSRTVFSSFHRLNAGEILIFHQESGQIVFHYPEVYFNHYEDYQDDLDERVWQVLNQPFQNLAKQYQSFGVMLSEGFDSRLVAGLAKNAGFELFTFTHGTRATRGAQITFRLAKLLSSQHQFDDLESGLPADAVTLRKQLLLCDNFSVPYWINGSEYFPKTGVDVVSAGTALDSSLGGHVFYKPSGSIFDAVAQRYTEILGQDIGLLRPAYIERLSEKLLNVFRQSLDMERALSVIQSRFHPDTVSLFEAAIFSIKDELENEVERIKSTGSSLPSQVLQRLFFENRARKYSFGQERTIHINNRIVVPSYEPIVMRLLSSIHPRYKLHHKLYLRLFKKYLPDLSAIENGGYRLSLRYPRLILETSRFVAKYQEKHLISRFLLSHGKSSIQEIRGVAFTELIARRGQTLEFFEQFFQQNADVLNSSSLRAWVARIREFRSRSYDLGNFYQTLEVFQALKGNF